MKCLPLALVLSLNILLYRCASPDVDAPERILVNGNILTVDANDSTVEALAIREGRIVAVGTTDEIEALAGADTERIDLEGLTATPGLLDAHNHFAWGGTDLLYVLDMSYPSVTKVADAAELVRDQVAQLEDGGWVRGHGWDEGKLDEQRYLYASDLDAVAPEHPVWLTHTMGHYGVASSKALELAGITRETADPPGGTIDRLPDGTPSGVLKESAQSLVSKLIPETSAEEWEAGIRHITAELNKEGMTGVKEPGIRRDEWDAYQKVYADGDLTARVFVLWLVGDSRDERASVDGAHALVEQIAPFSRPYEFRDNDVLISGGVKLYMDGSGGARTAWMHEEWNKNHTDVDDGNFGYPLFEPEVIREQIGILHGAGLHVSVHAIGDRAIDWIVDSYALALEDNPTSGLRHGIIHANIPSGHALDTIATLQRDYDAAIPEPSASFMWWIGDTYAGNFGPERTARLNPLRTYLDRGIRWADSSDFNVTPFPARYGLWASVKRAPLLGTHGDEPYGNQESVDIRTALRSRTIWAARQMFLEDEIGSIELGKYADIAVWDLDPYTADIDDVKDMECQMTLFAGDVVYVNEAGRLAEGRR